MSDEELHEPEMTAAQMLREFEDRILGESASRINGQIERGHGSKYQKMEPEQRQHHDALMRLVAAEDRMTTAKAELAAAMTAHAEAKARV